MIAGSADRPVGSVPHRAGQDAIRRKLLIAAPVLVLASCGGLSLSLPAFATARSSAPRFSNGQIFEARALGVDDGDSFVVRLADGQRARIRLAGIDAPEKSQPWSGAARNRLSALLANRLLKLTVLKTDRWERAVARVDADGIDVSLAMLESGLAWHFARYDRDLPVALARRYAAAEQVARRERAGLWRETDPEPPWAFRQRSRQP